MPLTICCLTTISIASILASYLWIGPADPQMSSWCPAGGSPGWGSAWHHSLYWDDPATQRKTVHNSDVIMGMMASQITSLVIVYSTVYSGANGRKHQSSASLAFVRGIHRWPVNFPQKASNVANVSIWWRHHVVTGSSISKWNITVVSH